MKNFRLIFKSVGCACRQKSSCRDNFSKNGVSKRNCEIIFYSIRLSFLLRSAEMLNNSNCDNF